MLSYPDTFTTESFTQMVDGSYKMVIPASTIGMDGSIDIRLSKFLRNTGGKYENTIAAYEVDLNGNVTIYSDEAFNGMLVITSD